MGRLYYKDGYGEEAKETLGYGRGGRLQIIDMSSTVRIALQALGALFGVLAILFGLAAWRLSTGPLSLGFLSPYMQEALEGEDLSYRFEFEDTVLVWPGWGEALEFHLTDLRIADASGATLAAVPAASLGLSGAALLSGSIAPTSIELIGPSLALVRDPDGRLHLAGSEEADPADDDAADSLVADLLDPPREDHPMARLERVSLRDASIVLIDEATDLTWTAPSADLTLNLDEAAILGHLSAELQVRDLETQVEVELFHHRESKMASAAIGFSGLSLVKLSFVAPELEEFAGLRVPLSGTIAFDVAPGGILSGVAFDITGGEGEVALPEVFPTPVPVRRLAAAGSVDGEFSRLVLDTFVVDTDRPSFYLDGTLWQTEAGIGLKGRFQAHDMPFDSLGDYWPEGFIEPGRQWIGQNVADGVIARLDAELDIGPGDFENNRFDAASAAGTLAFENTSIHYLRPMPPVVGVNGTGRFTGEALDLTMSGGRIEGIVASRGTALLSQIHSDEPRISVTIEAEGPAADALALLDHPRLGLVEQDRAGAGRGRRHGAHTLFALDLPLLLAIEPEQVEVNAVARVDDARIADIAGITTMTEGALRLGADNASMELRGTARLQGMPATIAWRENFDDGASFAAALRRDDHGDGRSPDRARVRHGALRAGHPRARRGLHRSRRTARRLARRSHSMRPRHSWKSRSCIGPSPPARRGRCASSRAFLPKTRSCSPGSSSRPRPCTPSAGPRLSRSWEGSRRSRSRRCGTEKPTSPAGSWPMGTRPGFPCGVPASTHGPISADSRRKARRSSASSFSISPSSAS